MLLLLLQPLLLSLSTRGDSVSVCGLLNVAITALVRLELHGPSCPKRLFDEVFDVGGGTNLPHQELDLFLFACACPILSGSCNCRSCCGLSWAVGRMGARF